MDILIKIISILGILFLLIQILIKADKHIEKIKIRNLRNFLKSFLYALMFTPTIYHHELNTIVAPFHLSTISGNMFYDYEYTQSMFVSGVILPIVLSLICIFSFITIRDYMSTPAISA